MQQDNSLSYSYGMFSCIPSKNTNCYVQNFTTNIALYSGILPLHLTGKNCPMIGILESLSWTKQNHLLIPIIQVWLSIAACLTLNDCARKVLCIFQKAKSNEEGWPWASTDVQSLLKVLMHLIMHSLIANQHCLMSKLKVMLKEKS